ncbi:MAG: Os1348 family NHLP clan protein [Anaerolineales bacterium]|nr:Os1348 family NHLP clan protein [Anaerolineales bacterium]
MSQQTVESVLTRAMSDAAFADSLFANPEKALTGFDLTAEEIASLKGMSRAEFE